MTVNKKDVLLSLHDLEISFGEGKQKFVAVQDVNFDIYRGETFSLVGESGSGKTTIGRANLGIKPTSNGEIYVNRNQINKKLPTMASGVNTQNCAANRCFTRTRFTN